MSEQILLAIDRWTYDCRRCEHVVVAQIIVDSDLKLVALWLYGVSM
jgi:hypothetical protein